MDRRFLTKPPVRTILFSRFISLSPSTFVHRTSYVAERTVVQATIICPSVRSFLRQNLVRGFLLSCDPFDIPLRCSYPRYQCIPLSLFTLPRPQTMLTMCRYQPSACREAPHAVPLHLVVLRTRVLTFFALSIVIHDQGMCGTCESNILQTQPCECATYTS